MKRIGIVLVCVLTCLASRPCAAAAVTNPANSPYATIAQRNIFRLEPPRPERPEMPPRPIAKITLTGTISLGGRRALLKAVLPAMPTVPARELSLILGEGQEQADIRVLEINEKAGSVKVDNLGTVMVLTFGPEPAKSPATRALAAPPQPSALPNPHRRQASVSEPPPEPPPQNPPDPPSE